MTLKEHDVVVVMAGPHLGEKGTILSVHDGGRAFTVEIVRSRCSQSRPGEPHIIVVPFGDLMRFR